MEAVALGKGQISLRLTLLKALGSWLAIVSGGSVGREGPLIQFGGGLGGTLGRLFRLRERQIRALIAAGAGAGFAAAYNTPIAAVLFVVEVVTGVIALDLVLPVIIAVPIATALTRLAIGGGPIYGQRIFSMNSNAELALYAGLGLLVGDRRAAVHGAAPARGSAVRQADSAASGARGARRCFGGCDRHRLAAGHRQRLRGDQSDLGSAARASLVLVVLFFAKALATTASVSSGSPGGVFTPSLLLGAALGGVIGHGVARFGPASSSGAVAAYALVGMAAMIAATTHAPLMATVLVFELSGDYAIVLPLLTACAIATVLSRRVHRESIYTEELRRRGSRGRSKSWPPNQM